MNKNTKTRGILHFRILKWNGRYFGICKETGFVEEDQNFDGVRSKLINGTLSLLEAIAKSNQDLEPSLNTHLPLKYSIYYTFAPVMSLIELIKDGFAKAGSENTGFYSFARTIENLKYCNG